MRKGVTWREEIKDKLWEEMCIRTQDVIEF